MMPLHEAPKNCTIVQRVVYGLQACQSSLRAWETQKQTNTAQEHCSGAGRRARTKAFVSPCSTYIMWAPGMYHVGSRHVSCGLQTCIMWAPCICTIERSKTEGTLVVWRFDLHQSPTRGEEKSRDYSLDYIQLCGWRTQRTSRIQDAAGLFFSMQGSIVVIAKHKYFPAMGRQRRHGSFFLDTVHMRRD